MAQKNIITIIGLGLIGGSLAMALKKTGKYHVMGFSRHRLTIKKALKMKVIDEAQFSLKKAVKNADIVFVCVPISEMKITFKKIAPYLKQGCIVTDVGSTKVQIMKCAKETLPSKIIFIGGHPMAGSEKSGIDNIRQDLFVGKPWCLIQPKDTPGHQDSSGGGEATTSTPPRWRRSLMILTKIITAIGAKPVIISADEHDKSVALISHLPFIISRALMKIAIESKEWKNAKKLASTGFASMTRLANGNTQMHQNILATNGDNIGRYVETLIKQLLLIK